jgi:hypothetical protein
MGEFVAMEGDLELFRWVVAVGCPMSVETTRAAEKYGHIEIFKRAVMSGAPYVPTDYYRDERLKVWLAEWEAAPDAKEPGSM